MNLQNDISRHLQMLNVETCLLTIENTFYVLFLTSVSPVANWDWNCSPPHRKVLTKPTRGPKKAMRAIEKQFSLNISCKPYYIQLRNAMSYSIRVLSEKFYSRYTELQDCLAYIGLHWHAYSYPIYKSLSSISFNFNTLGIFTKCPNHL